ncbi:uncharacterized protein [Palaemon carinicauda]|uniref:uncharacterized protein isoform X2 n=1 Tax=Palaemon carinicauda TaxID=392227 RepID=UPI0035B60ACB
MYVFYTYLMLLYFSFIMLLSWNFSVQKKWVMELCLLRNKVKLGRIYCWSQVTLKKMKISFIAEIPSEFDAAFVLVDNSILYLTYKLYEPIIEVLAVDPVDGSLLSSGTDYRCRGSNGDGYSCTVNVDIPDRKNSVNFIVVLTTSEGYAESSNTYSFQTFQLQVEYLMDRAIYLSWTVEHSGEYDVSVSKGYDFHNDKFHQSISCENGRLDQGMIHVEDGDVVAVQQKGSPDVMAVYITFPDKVIY